MGKLPVKARSTLFTGLGTMLFDDAAPERVVDNINIIIEDMNLFIFCIIVIDYRCSYHCKTSYAELILNIGYTLETKVFGT